jgi:hypothetical protein
LLFLLKNLSDSVFFILDTFIKMTELNFDFSSEGNRVNKLSPQNSMCLLLPRDIIDLDIINIHQENIGVPNHLLNRYVEEVHVGECPIFFGLIGNH